jgi:hypothetical protein
MLAPEQLPTGTRYTLFIQPINGLAANLIDILDAKLRFNPHYDYCRTLGQLHQPAIFKIARDAYATYAAARQATGQRLGDIKPAALDGDNHWAQHFDGCYVGIAEPARSN